MWPERFRATTRRGLAAHADFRNLWAAQATSQFGSQITLLAIPLVAALTLDVSPAQMGLLATLESLPIVFLSLFAGVWVDRRARRPILVAADLGRAFILLTIPLAWLFDRLTFEHLIAVGVATSTLTVAFNVAYRSYLPSLVPKEHLVEANGKLEATASSALVAGPFLAGGLIAVAGGPIAIVLDALSYLASGAFLARIRAAEQPPEAGPSRNVRAEIAEGLRFVLSNPLLRSLIGLSATWRFFDSVVIAVFVLFITRDLDLGATAIGIIFAAMGVGMLSGSALAARVARWLGLGPAIIASATMSSLGGALLALASGPALVAASVLALGYLLMGFGGAIVVVHAMTIRQAVTPPELHGRMNASFMFTAGIGGPIGFAAGGLLGSTLGLRETLVIGAIGGVLGFLWVLFSPLRLITTLTDATPAHDPHATSPQLAPDTIT